MKSRKDNRVLSQSNHEYLLKENLFLIQIKRYEGGLFWVR